MDENEPLAVLWEDAHGLAVDKPSGMLTQGTPGSDSHSDSVEVTLESLVRRHLRPDDPASVYLGTVHRLDRPVSGVILWAKTPKAARRWAHQFASREVRKEYRAIVEGDVSKLGKSGTWDDWIARPDGSGRARLVESGTPGAARALTDYEVETPTGSEPSTSRLTLRPLTGRTHQLRAQTTGRGLPIVGDLTYGSTRPFRRGIALHARSLAVEHPVTRRPLVLEAPLPASWS